MRTLRCTTALIGLFGIVGCNDGSMSTGVASCDTIYVNGLKDTYKLGETAALNVQVGSSNGIALPCPNSSSGIQNKQYNIGTSDSRVVTVTATSLLYAAGIGTATISVSGNSLKPFNKTVHVVAP